MVFSEKLRVTRHDECAPSWYKIAFEAPHIAAEATPGQFFMVRVGSGTDPFLRRPMSLHRLVRNDGGHIIGFELLYKVVGRGTALLSEARVGEHLDVLGPLGHGFRIEEGARHHCVVIGGTGVAPMPAFVDVLLEAGIRPTVLYGARTGVQLVCRKDFEHEHVALRLFTDDGSLGTQGMVTGSLEDLLSSAVGEKSGGSGAVLYACGPHAMLTVVAQLAARLDIPCQVSLESRMGCGIGACMSCAVRAAESGPDGEPRYLRACLEGPVFDSRLVFWEHES
jgi:dihydroorotate dehydrogenase electron transfer subunit